MHKIKSFFAVLLTVAVVAACAMLPTFVAGMQDNVQQDEITVGDVNEVKLEVKNLSMKEKLYLFCYGNTVNTPTDKTNLQEEEIHDLVEEQLEPYIKNGMISDSLTEYDIICAPITHYEVGNLDMYNIFWDVYICSVGEEYFESWIYIDDETGKIISIGYNCEEIYDVNDDMLNDFVNIYLDNINSGEESTMYPDYYVENEYDVNGEDINAVFNWEDIRYGELVINFYITSNAFYTWIS